MCNIFLLQQQHAESNPKQTLLYLSIASMTQKKKIQLRIRIQESGTIRYAKKIEM